MIYLLAKYTLLFLLTALLGFVLGHWWSRRNFVDVSESYEELRKAKDHSGKRDWDRLWKRLDEIPAPDNRPLVERLDKIDRDIRAIPVPEKPTAVDLAPINRRLDVLDADIWGLSKHIARPAISERPVQKSSREEPRILKADLYGKRDDLKLISGVGPKLERLLNHNGVYYFWQVAEWKRSDINIIDERLETFKGRITRDNWVTQAKSLSRRSGSASMPTE